MNTIKTTINSACGHAKRVLSKANSNFGKFANRFIVGVFIIVGFSLGKYGVNEGDFIFIALAIYFTVCYTTCYAFAFIYVWRFKEVKVSKTGHPVLNKKMKAEIDTIMNYELAYCELRIRTRIEKDISWVRSVTVDIGKTNIDVTVNKGIIKLEKKRSVKK